MSATLTELIAVLDLERIEDNLFRGRVPRVGWTRVFGGLVVSQALVAASRTVEPDRPPHSLHCYFLRPGDPAIPIVYEVDRIREGRSFTTRRCLAVQHGEPIFALSASFHVAETGLDHAFAMPSVPDPDDLPGPEASSVYAGAMTARAAHRLFGPDRPIELRPVDLAAYCLRSREAPQLSGQMVWVRAAGSLPDDPAIHRAVLAYLSDMTLIDTIMAAHGRAVFDPDLQPASLDHALWFHRPFRCDDWLLYAQDSPSAANARGIARGSIYARDGRLVASVIQEGLIRLREAAI